VVDIPIAYNLGACSVSQYANDYGLDFLASDGLHLIAGTPFYTDIAQATSFYNILDVNSILGINTINTLTPAPANTLTTAEFYNLNLIAGETLVIDYDYVPTDVRFKDFAFAMLQDSSGGLTTKILGTVNNYAVSGGQTHFTESFSITTSDTYNLLLGSADVGDANEPSTLTIHSVVEQIPSTDYTITANGLALIDGSAINSSGAYVPAGGGGAQLGVLSSNGAAVMSVLTSLYASNLISQDGSGLVPTTGGGLALPSGISLISSSGAPAVSHDGGTLIGQDGSNLLDAAASNAVSHDGGTLITLNGDSLISQDGSTLISTTGNGLAGSDTYSFFLQDIAGGVTRYLSRNAPVAPSSGPATPGTEYFVSPTAVSFVYDVTPAETALPNGRFVVAWTQAAGGTQSIQVQLDNADGNAAGSAVSINPITTHSLDANLVPAVVPVAGGGFAVVYSESFSVLGTSGFTETVRPASPARA